MNRPTDKRIFQLFHLIPFALFITGIVLTVVGATALLKAFKRAGPVVMVLSGLLLFFYGIAAFAARSVPFRRYKFEA